MRILIISNYYPPYEIGGYEQLCRDVATRLEARGHTVDVLTSDYGASRGTIDPESTVYRKLRLMPDYRSRLSPAVQFYTTRRAIEGRNLEVFRDEVGRFQPDVIFIWNLQGLPHELSLDAEAQLHAAVAYWLAGYTPAEPDLFWRYWTQPPLKRSRLQGMKNILGRAALAQMRREGKPVRPQMQHVAVVSDYMRRKGWSEGTLPAHTEVIYNGVETDQFYRPVPETDAPPPVNLLVAGRVSADKGVHVAVEAAGRLAQTRPEHDFRLTIAGSGPADYLDHLQQLTTRYQIADRVSFTGWLPRERMPSLMQSCHVLLLPTVHQEPFARVTLEGMAAGLAIIGTLTGGTGELLKDGINGLTFATEDSADLARQIARLLDDPQLRHLLAARGQKMVLERYRLEYMIDQLEDLLKRAFVEQYARHT